MTSMIHPLRGTWPFQNTQARPAAGGGETLSLTTQRRANSQKQVDRRGVSRPNRGGPADPLTLHFIVCRYEIGHQQYHCHIMITSRGENVKGKSFPGDQAEGPTLCWIWGPFQVFLLA